MSLNSSLDNTVLHATPGLLLMSFITCVVEADLGATGCLILAVTVFIALILVVLHVELISHFLGEFTQTEEVEIIEFGDGFLEPSVNAWPHISWGRCANVRFVAFRGNGVDGVSQVVGKG
jgi:hypothetical protein